MDLSHLPDTGMVAGRMQQIAMKTQAFAASV